MSAPIPAWVITGPLGCGKTTLIAGLLAAKPADERWAVLLNEFTDAGIDALTVAAAARGPFDVRLIPGGCLCCAGEADFRRTLQELVAGPRPARIIVEPSGIGHPAGIVEELLAHQAAGGIRLEGVLGLVDPASLVEGASTDGASIDGGPVRDERDELARATAEIADVLALAKGDLATPAQVAAFEAQAAALFPAKRRIGQVMQGQVPADLLEALRAMGSVVLRDAGSVSSAASVRPHSHAAERASAAEHDAVHDHAHDHAHGAARGTDAVAVAGAGERVGFSHLGRVGARWTFPPSVSFSEARVLMALGADTEGLTGLGRPERIKAVLRVDEDEWVLVQRADGRVSVAPSAWRRDNRIEVQLAPGSDWDPRAWDAVWHRAMRGPA